jgi:hypothetical protein
MEMAQHKIKVAMQQREMEGEEERKNRLLLRYSLLSLGHLLISRRKKSLRIQSEDRPKCTNPKTLPQLLNGIFF